MDKGKLRPDGLNEGQLERLEEHVHRGQMLAPDVLLQAAYEHLEDMRSARAEQPGADLAMAEAIVHVLDRLVADWDTFSPVEQSWLRGVMRYFSKSRDERPDAEAGGFRDDLEVLNACLRYVHREELVLTM